MSEASSSLRVTPPDELTVPVLLPGLPYLGGLPPEFELPRRENPRVKVPPGSIAVAMSMTVVYPQESPGGWHILARTPAPLWDMRRTPPALLAAGDKVTFAPVSLREYEQLSAKAASGELKLALSWVVEGPARSWFRYWELPRAVIGQRSTRSPPRLTQT